MRSTLILLGVLVINLGTTVILFRMVVIELRAFFICDAFRRRGYSEAGSPNAWDGCTWGERRGKDFCARRHWCGHVHSLDVSNVWKDGYRCGWIRNILRKSSSSRHTSRALRPFCVGCWSSAKEPPLLAASSGPQHHPGKSFHPTDESPDK